MGGMSNSVECRHASAYPAPLALSQASFDSWWTHTDTLHTLPPRVDHTPWHQQSRQPKLCVWAMLARHILRWFNTASPLPHVP
ncbi:hypothetical protein OEZ85_008107 [Tetradesmus obliquus]|uniref:Uncharacterized protein n=1 Tax=Tetradesmus obliquus TaxID=3088 RepID=A0ABY8TI47_TETOB|nr:hypothetical protein OEZ85_008107 [Tetradesmus obliquus]